MKKEQLVMEVKEHLTGRILPFWEKLRDVEYGGYYGYLDYDLKLDRRAEKGCILNSRILWFFSNAAMTLGDKQLMPYAAHAYDFLRSCCLDETYGGIYWSLTYDGEALDDTKHTYNQAFAIYALSSYYDASGCQEALDLAWKLFDVIETHCKDEQGYLEAFHRDFTPASNEKLSENGVMAEKTMNTLLHVFEAYTELYRVTGDVRVKKQLEWVLGIFADKVYNPALRRQEVFFDKDWNTLIDLHSYGHDIETAWLIDRGLEVLAAEADKAAAAEAERAAVSADAARMHEITRALTAKIYERAYRDHSLLNECERGVDNTHRIWWVQAEAVVGFLNGWQKQPEKTEYFEAAADIWTYIRDRLNDPREGSEWFWELDGNGDPIPGRPIVEPWKCPYHNGRMCFEVIRRLS